MPAAARRATSVLLADDHRLVRTGLRHLLDQAENLFVQAEADNGNEALELLQQQAVDVIVADLTMPGLSGMALLRRLKADHPQTALLVLTMHAEEQYAVDAFRAGANGYLTKDVAAEELVAAIRKVAAGGTFVTQSMAERLARDLQQQRTAPPHTTLTERELAVFRGIVSGRRLTDIGEELHLSVKTVSTHKSHLLDKLQLHSVADLIKYALQHGLFSDEGDAAS